MCEVSNAVLVALHSGAVVISVVPQLVCLEPVRREPRSVAFFDVKSHQWQSVWCVHVLVEYLDGQSTVKHFNYCVRIAMVVDGTAVSTGPYLQNIRHDRRAAAITAERNAQVCYGAPFVSKLKFLST